MRVITGSKNPVKVEAVRQAFKAVFPNEDIEVVGEKSPSGVADQPMSHEETYQGAFNRAQYCKEHYDADYFVGVEGGLTSVFNTGKLALTVWSVVLAKETDITGIGGGDTVLLPQALCDALKGSENLAQAGDKFFATTNIGQGEGVIGKLTNGRVKRVDWSREPVIQALTLHAQAWK